MTTIKSLFSTETYINDPDKFDILPNSILELFKCPISRDYYTMPVCLSNGQIYDKPSIIEWLSRNDIDPLTGLKMTPANIKLIPIINIILAMKCIEIKHTDSGDEIVRFYNPYGYLPDLLRLVSDTLHTTEIDNSHKFTGLIKKAGVEYLEKTHVKSLDLRDCFFCSRNDAEKVETSNGFNYKYYTITEILNSCCLTQKPIYGHSLLTESGFLIHENCKIINIIHTYNSAYLSGDVLYMKVTKITPVLNLDLLDIKKSTEEFKLDTNQPKVVNDIPESKLTDHVINIFTCKRPTPRLSIFFKKVTYETDWYLSFKSSEEQVYERYFKYKPTQFIQARLQEFYEIINTRHRNPNPDERSEFGSLRSYKNSLEIPDSDCIYSIDYSYMKINPTTLFNKYNKMTYFCFTHFNNVIIQNGTFECCHFAGATGRILFINCKFGTSNCVSNSFYKSNLDMTFINCKFSGPSFEALPEKYKKTIKPFTF